MNEHLLYQEARHCVGTYFGGYNKFIGKHRFLYYVVLVVGVVSAITFHINIISKYFVIISRKNSKY